MPQLSSNRWLVCGLIEWVVVAAVCAQPSPEVVGAPTEAEIADLLESFPRLEGPERLEAASAVFLGARYVLSPLGEGAPPDSDPRLRLDAFDCTTYIETVAALALSSAWEELQPALDELRYRSGAPNFTARHHLPVAQWLPAFQERGLLAEATVQFGGDTTRRLVIELSAERWRSRTRARSLDLPAETVPRGSFGVDFLPIDRAVELLASADEPLVLNVVRRVEEGSPIVVTHQALLFPSEAGPRIRHASSVHGGVVEMSLGRFVAGQALARRWPVVGLNVQRWTLSGSASGAEPQGPGDDSEGGSRLPFENDR